MPNLPKWIADQMENLLSSKYIDITAIAVVNYNAEIKKVTFSADLSKIDNYVGQSVVLRVSSTELRRYTISSFDKKSETFEILFHIHGNGPGSKFADRLVPGDTLKISVSGGRNFYDKEKTSHFIFGDETSLGFYNFLRQEIEKNHQQCNGIFELSENNLSIPEDFGFDVQTVLRTPKNPGQNAIHYLIANIKAKPEFFQQSVFYLTGNIASVQRLRKVLRDFNINSKNIKTQGYWMERRAGL